MRENQLCIDAFSDSCSPQTLPLDASIVIPVQPNQLRHLLKTISLDVAIKTHDLQSLKKKSQAHFKAHITSALYNINIQSNFMLLFSIIFLLIHQKTIQKGHVALCKK